MHLSLQTETAKLPPGCQHWKPVPNLFTGAETLQEEGKGRAFTAPSSLVLLDSTSLSELTVELSLVQDCLSDHSQREERVKGLLS